ncbi:MAG: alternate-type signal peptide domain-containing protein [Nocardioides sp.]
MNKSTKGALAATTAGVLLLGGAGSLAFWSDSVTIGGSTISSGHIKLEDTTTGGCATAKWRLDGGEVASGAIFDPASSTLVPGDRITKTCTFNINAVGDHLRATLTATGGQEVAPATGDDLGPDVTTTAAFTVNNATATSITEGNNGQVLEATIALQFPYGIASDNLSQDDTLDLSAYTVALTQVHS